MNGRWLKVPILACAVLMAACGSASPAPSTLPPAVASGASAPPVQAPAPATVRPGSAGASASPTLNSAASELAPSFGRGSVSIQTKAGSVDLSVEVADDAAKREYGLMNRRALPVDAGMLFVFQPPAGATQIGFWMKDTLIPLSIAFVEPNMAIESIQEMQALDETVHYAPRDYMYAIEANQGFFSGHAVSVGDKVSIKR